MPKEIRDYIRRMIRMTIAVAWIDHDIFFVGMHLPSSVCEDLAGLSVFK